MRFYFSQHQHKGNAYLDALTAAGHERTTDPAEARFSFFDTEIRKDPTRFDDTFQFPAELVQAAQYGPVFNYPHAARPQVILDVYDLRFPFTTAFVVSEGHREILSRFGYEVPTVATGWAFTEIRPFTPGRFKMPLEVLYAPLHPNGNGFMDDCDKAANRRVFDRLVSMPFVSLTVRTVKKPIYSGLPGEWPGVRYIEGNADGSTADIENADLVVSHQTYAYNAVALGKPTIMYHDIAPHSNNLKPLYWARNFHRYANLLRFPLQFQDYDGDGLIHLIQVALKGCDEVEEWKARMIGKPFCSETVLDTVGRFL